MRSAFFWGGLACGGCAWGPASDPGVSTDTAAAECATDATLPRRSSTDPDVRWTISRSDGAMAEAVGGVPTVHIVTGVSCTPSIRLEAGFSEPSAEFGLTAHFVAPPRAGSVAPLAASLEASLEVVDQFGYGAFRSYVSSRFLGGVDPLPIAYFAGDVILAEVTEERLSVRVEGEDLHGVDDQGARIEVDWLQIDAEAGSTPFPLVLPDEPSCQTSGIDDPLGSGLCVGQGEGSSYPCPCPVELPWSAE